MPCNRIRKHGPKLPSDLQGLRSGKLTITGRADGVDQWSTSCDCGRLGVMHGKSFRKRESKRCKGRACIRREHLLTSGQTFGDWTVVDEDHEPNRERQYNCRCSCGSRRSIPVSKLVDGSTTRCQECRLIGERNLLKYSHPYTAWKQLAITRPHTICKDWQEDFSLFLDEYLKVTGTTVEDHYDRPLDFRPYKIARPNLYLLYGPGNLSVIHMITERAWDTRTYRLWRRLKKKNLLVPELANNYIHFLNTFGTKQPGFLLARHDYAEPHSADNSFWINR